MKLRTNTFLNASGLLVAQGIFLVLGFLLHMILARHYGPAFYGQYVFIMSVLIWIEIAVNSGVPGVISKLIPESQHSSELLIIGGMKLNAIAAIIAMFSLAILSWPIGILYGDSQITRLIIVASPDIFLYSIYAFLGGVLCGRKEFLSQGVGIVLYITSKFVLLTFAAFSRMDLSWVFIGNWLASCLGVIYLWWAVRPEIRLWSQSRMDVKTISASSFMAIYWFCFYLVLSMDLWFVKGIIEDDSLVGCYAAATAIAKLPLYLFTVLNSMALPLLTEAHIRNKPDEIIKNAHNILSVGLFLGGAMTLSVSLNADFFIETLFGVTYAQASSPLSILIWGVFLASLGSFLSLWLIAINRQQIVVLVSLGTVILVGILLYLMVSRFFIKGAAITEVFVSIVMMIIIYLFVRDTPLHKVFVKLTSKVGFALFVSFIAFSIFQRPWFATAFAYRTSANGIMLLVFTLMCFLLNVVRTDDLVAIKNSLLGAQSDAK
jgi:O-antigen/teichoic acid export membrane protein